MLTATHRHAHTHSQGSHAHLESMLRLLMPVVILAACLGAATAQQYANPRRYVPPPMYPDNLDYAESANYPDYAPAISLTNEQPEKSWSIAHYPQINHNAAINRLNYTPVYDPKWPATGITLGQVSAVSLDDAGRVYVFHRATRVWDGTTFVDDNRYWNINEPPIDSPTIAVFNSTTGSLIEQWGENLFYMPHGLTVDSDKNIWITDVALHQVMKFRAGEKQKPSITLGVRFEPGTDDFHYCKPSAVAVMKSGDFFVSDGYCNHRIIKYDSNGKKLLQWGRSSFRGAAQVVPQPYSFTIPHALALAEDKNLICVADRENGRVQCFRTDNGTFVLQIHSPVIGNRLFSVAYSPVKGGRLYLVNGREFMGRPVRGFVVDVDSKRILSEFGPLNKDFSNPHDIAVSKDGKEVYVVELDPYKVHKFVDDTLTEEPDSVKDTSVKEVTVNKKGNPPNVTVSNPTKPTTTIEGQSIVFNGWSGWAGVAGGVAGGLSAVLLLLIGGAALLARAKRRGGCLSPLTPRNRRQRWDYAPGAPDFKLRHLLDRQRNAGFERINTEESDEEPTPATSMLAPQNA